MLNVKDEIRMTNGEETASWTRKRPGRQPEVRKGRCGCRRCDDQGAGRPLARLATVQSPHRILGARADGQARPGDRRTAHLPTRRLRLFWEPPLRPRPRCELECDLELPDQLWSGDESRKAVVPALCDLPDAVDAWADRLALFAVGMVQAEAARRGVSLTLAPVPSRRTC